MFSLMLLFFLRALCVVLLVVSFLGTLSADKQCSYDLSNQTAGLENHTLSANMTCVWLMEVPHDESYALLYVTLREARLAPGEDVLKVMDNKPDIGRIIFQSQHFTAPLVVASSALPEDTKVISVIFSAGASPLLRNVVFTYNVSAPVVTVDLAPVTFISPTYRVQPNDSALVEASFFVPHSQQRLALTFSQFMLDQSLKGDGESPEVVVYELGHKGNEIVNYTFTDGASVRDIVTRASGHGFRVYARLSQKHAQGFVADVYPVTRGDAGPLQHFYLCSGEAEVGVDGVVWSTSTDKQQYSNNLLCVFQLTAPQGKRLIVSKTEAELADANDQLQVFDRGSSGAYLLGSISQANQASPRVHFVSSGRHVLLRFTSDASRASGRVTVTVRLREHGGTFFSAASFSLPAAVFPSLADSERRYFTLIADSGKKVRTQVKASLSSPNTSVVFFEQRAGRYVTLRTLWKGQADDDLPVVSAGRQLIVLAKGFFGNQTLSGSFSSVDNDPLQYLSEDTQTVDIRMKLSGGGRQWLINPQQPNCMVDLRVSLDMEPSSGVMHLRTLLPRADSLRLMGPGPLPVIRLDATAGILMNVTGAENDSWGFRLQYFCASACGELLSSNTPLLSPGAPGPYPLGSTCEWRAERSSLSWQQFSLPPNHTLSVREQLNGTTRTLGVYDGKTTVMPNLMSAGSLYLRLQAPLPALLTSSSDAGGQLHAQVKANFSCGGVVTSLDGNLTSELVQGAHSCRWLLQATSGVISFTLSLGATDDPHEQLVLRNGGRLISPVLHYNTSLSTQRLRSSARWLTVVYSGQGSPRRFSLSELTTSVCPAADTCLNGLCMQPGWRCDGANDCGDWSDEINCGKAPPTSAPSPGPTSAPSGGGVSPLVVGVLLPLCLLLGFAAAWFGPRVLRRIRQPSYTRMPSVPT